MNPRYAAFILSGGVGAGQYFTFISQMKSAYLNANGIKNDIPGGGTIYDHEGFTKFIINQVRNGYRHAKN